jgi:hypothetical protein
VKEVSQLLFWAADHVNEWRGYAIGALTLLVYIATALVYELYIREE